MRRILLMISFLVLNVMTLLAQYGHMYPEEFNKLDRLNYFHYGFEDLVNIKLDSIYIIGNKGELLDKIFYEKGKRVLFENFYQNKLSRKVRIDSCDHYVQYGNKEYKIPFECNGDNQQLSKARYECGHIDGYTHFEYDSLGRLTKSIYKHIGVDSSGMELQILYAGNQIIPLMEVIYEFEIQNGSHIYDAVLFKRYHFSKGQLSMIEIMDYEQGDKYNDILSFEYLDKGIIEVKIVSSHGKRKKSKKKGFIQYYPH